MAFRADEDDPRCPKCLRKSSVQSEEAPFRTPDGGVPFRTHASRFGIGFMLGCGMFYVLTINDTLLGVRLGGGGFRLYAVLLGGVLLSFGWMLFPRIAPWRKR